MHLSIKGRKGGVAGLGHAVHKGEEGILRCLAVSRPGPPCPAYFLLTCLALPCLALPCLALPCIALHCIAFPCLALPYLTLPCLALPYLASPRLASPRYEHWGTITKTEERGHRIQARTGTPHTHSRMNRLQRDTSVRSMTLIADSLQHGISAILIVLGFAEASAEGLLLRQSPVDLDHDVAWEMWTESKVCRGAGGFGASGFRRCGFCEGALGKARLGEGRAPRTLRDRRAPRRIRF